MTPFEIVLLCMIGSIMIGNVWLLLDHSTTLESIRSLVADLRFLNNELIDMENEIEKLREELEESEEEND